MYKSEEMISEEFVWTCHPGSAASSTLNEVGIESHTQFVVTCIGLNMKEEILSTIKGLKVLSHYLRTLIDGPPSSTPMVQDDKRLPYMRRGTTQKRSQKHHLGSKTTHL